MAFVISEIFGWLATFLFTIMLVPQIIKTIKLKDTSGVSLLLFIIYLISNIIALIYAFLISQSPLIIKYSLAILITSFYVGLFFYYRGKQKVNI